MKTRVFIDGKEGTTGLQIYERFQNRNDVEIMLIDEEKRKDVSRQTRQTGNGGRADRPDVCGAEPGRKTAVSYFF